jgi:ATP phosphoribosyltransferase
MVAESGASVTVALKLGFGKCRLSLQVPEEHLGKPISDYVGARIVTSFPNIAGKFFAPFDAAENARKQQFSKSDGRARKDSNEVIQTQIRYVSGSVEAACGLGLADAVVDLVETGTTMRAAGLDELTTLMETEAVLIQNPQSKHAELAERIVKRIAGYLDSTKYQLMSYNAPRDELDKCIKITPGKKSPSIMPLERGDWVAVSVMVLKKQVAELIEKLESCGATDILVFDLTNCRV